MCLIRGFCVVADEVADDGDSCGIAVSPHHGGGAAGLLGLHVGTPGELSGIWGPRVRCPVCNT